LGAYELNQEWASNTGKAYIDRMSFGNAEYKNNSTDLEHVVTAIFYCRIKHSLFPSLCIEKNHETVLEKQKKYIVVFKISICL